MIVRIIDKPFLLSAHSLDAESRNKLYPIIFLDLLKKDLYVMVKGFKLTSLNKYEVIT